MNVNLITAPSSEPVTLAEAQAQCRTDDATDTALLTRLISDARQQAEHAIGRKVGAQTLELVIDDFPDGSISLPFPPVASVVSIKYDDIAGVEQTLSGSAYRSRISCEPASIVPVSEWPSTLGDPGSVRVRFTCGITSASAHWENLRQWILLAVATMYAQREAIVQGSTAELPRSFFDSKLDGLRYYG